jgi:hypothetical protein
MMRLQLLPAVIAEGREVRISRRQACYKMADIDWKWLCCSVAFQQLRKYEEWVSRCSNTSHLPLINN